jgi:hypothetical protein
MWRHFTAQDGLGDDSIYALACDAQGRVWMGHLNHGVTVFNGEKFQNYEVVGGLSRSDSRNGPLGERIFKIAVAPGFGEKPEAGSQKPAGPVFHDGLTGVDSPVAGSVWMASSAGLAIYFPSTDTWSYLTRAEGLPSDQANALAFDGQGRVYVGTQCDGIALADPADHYATWQQVTAAHPTPHAVEGKIVDVPVPTVGKGKGLPTDLINDLLVAKDGTVYAATTLGLAWSVDRGNTWQYVRGADWVDKVKNRFGGPPVGWVAPSDAARGGGMLAEDYVTALAEGKDGNIFVGHRNVEGDVVSSQAEKKLDLSAKAYVTSLVSIRETGSVLRGSYGQGLSVDSLNDQVSARQMGLQLPASFVHQPAYSSTLGPSEFKPSGVLPSGAVPQDAIQMSGKLRAFLAAPQRVKDEVGTIAVLSDDFATQGNWINHYGMYASLGCAQNGHYDFLTGYRGAWFSCRSYIGRNNRDNDVLRRWVDTVQSDEGRVLQYLQRGGRKQASWDDHGEVYPSSWMGPDIYCSMKLPKGKYIISLYFVNYRGHWDDFPYAQRDFGVECRYTPMTDKDYRLLEKSGGAGETAFSSAPLVARSRAEYFWGGVYKRFYVNVGNPGIVTVKVNRNYSLNATLSGVLVDPAGPLCGPGGPEQEPAKAWTPCVPKASGDEKIKWAELVEEMLIYRDSHSLAYYTDGRRYQLELLRGVLTSPMHDLEQCQAGMAVRQMPALRPVFAECLRDQHLFPLFDSVFLDSEDFYAFRWQEMTKDKRDGIQFKWTVQELIKYRQEREAKFLWRSNEKPEI